MTAERDPTMLPPCRHLLLLSALAMAMPTAARSVLMPATQSDDARAYDRLMTLHALRHAYDPARLPGPLITTTATRRVIDRLRRHGRSSARWTSIDDLREGAAAVAPIA